MNRIITVVTKGIGSIRKAIVKYMSTPKEVQAATSAVNIGRTDENKKIPGSISWFTDHQKEEPDELQGIHVDSVPLSEYLQLAVGDNKWNYSINHKLSYNKKKTQRRNWSKWKRRNR